eukprot:6172962-Pleurochrysis_carterae.AAC.2
MWGREFIGVPRRRTEPRRRDSRRDRTRQEFLNNSREFAKVAETAKAEQKLPSVDSEGGVQPKGGRQNVKEGGGVTYVREAGGVRQCKVKPREQRGGNKIVDGMRVRFARVESVETGRGGRMQ